MTCCDHPRIRLHWHTRPDGSKGPFWLTCACGAFTDYAATHDEAWALETTLCAPAMSDRTVEAKIAEMNEAFASSDKAMKNNRPNAARPLNNRGQRIKAELKSHGIRLKWSAKGFAMAWRRESALSSPVRTPAAALPRQSGDYPREVV